MADNLQDGIDVQFTLTPDTVVGHMYRQTSEDDYADTPVTLVDAVVERIAALMLRRVEEAAKERFGGYNGYNGYSGIVDAKIGPAVDARVEALVTSLMAESLTRTNEFGRPNGEPTTLQEVVTTRIDKWLNEASRDSFDRGKGTRLQQALAKVIDREMQKALDKAIGEAQQKALAVVSATAEAALVQGLRTSIARAAAQA